jgi:hypothetical protein
MKRSLIAAATLLELALLLGLGAGIAVLAGTDPLISLTGEVSPAAGIAGAARSALPRNSQLSWQR